MYKNSYVSRAEIQYRGRLPSWLRAEIQYRESLRLGSRLPSDKKIVSTPKAERPTWLRAMCKYR